MLDLENASREELIQLNLQLIARLHLLEQRIKQLEAELESLRGGGPKSGPPSFVKANRPARSKTKKRRKRVRGFAGKLDKPTARLEHSLEQCPDCQVSLTGRRVIKTRQVIELPPVQVQVIEHVLIERRCPNCRKRWAPQLDLTSVTVGNQRLGISVEATIMHHMVRCAHSFPRRLTFRCPRYCSRNAKCQVTRREASSMAQTI